MDYDLTRLGSREFEHLAQSLAVNIIGSSVGIFGDGPDGGREADFSGTGQHIDAAGQTWTGYGVLQAKFRERPLGTAPDTAWFLSQVSRELKKWTSPKSARSKSKRMPENLIIVTNVVLSGVADSGGIDKSGELISGFARQMKLRRWEIWHYDKLCRFIDTQESIRKAFAGLITPGDILARLHEYVEDISPELSSSLISHAAKELLADQWVKLGQAGQPDNDKIALGSIAIDLRASSPLPDGTEVRNFFVAKTIIEQGNLIWSPSRDQPGKGNCVIIGGPGTGKTTIGQLICQAYRFALLSDLPPARLGREAEDAIASLGVNLQELDLPQPILRRWPIRLTLTSFADALADGREMSLMRFLAERVSKRLVHDVTATQLRRWLKAWPWLLVLDGLDEVASGELRELIRRQLSEFMIDAAQVNADLLVVATTRPQGYTEEFSPKYFDHWSLLPLTVGEALKYSDRMARVRHRSDSDGREAIAGRMKIAADSELTKRLMRSPLQVTIMSLLLERRNRAPKTRYGLFQAYYETIFARETSKDTPGARLLEDHAVDIAIVHQRVGVLLQLRSQYVGEAESLLPLQEVRKIAMERLLEKEYSETEANVLAGRIVQASTDRLVLLVQERAGFIGFEIRSLQEFMAAKAIGTGADAQVCSRLSNLAASSYWRNTLLLAIGHLFVNRDHLQAEIVTLLRDMDTSSQLNMIIRPGARLSKDLLEDQITVTDPRMSRLLAAHAIEVVREPPGTWLDEFAVVLFDIASHDNGVDSIVRKEVSNALRAGDLNLFGALSILRFWAAQTGSLAAWSQQVMHRALKELKAPQIALGASLDAFGLNIPPIVRTYQKVPGGKQSLSTVFRKYVDRKAALGPEWRPLLASLARLKLEEVTVDNCPTLLGTSLPFNLPGLDDDQTLRLFRESDALPQTVASLRGEDQIVAVMLAQHLASLLAREPIDAAFAGSFKWLSAEKISLYLPKPV